METIFSYRQLVQSSLQFAAVFLTGLGVKWSDLNADVVWSAAIQAALASIAILMASFVPPAKPTNDVNGKG